MKIFFIISFAIFLFATIGNAQQSIEDSLNRVIAENKDEADVSRAYNALAYEYTRKDPVKARHYLSAAITIAKKINNRKRLSNAYSCLLYTSDAADDLLCVDLGGRRIIKKKKKK